MKNLPSYEQFINESTQHFKMIIEQNYDINDDKTILVNSNLTQDVINNVAKGGDAASKIKSEMVKLLNKKTGGIGHLSAFACNDLKQSGFVDLVTNFFGEEFKNVKLKTWMNLGSQEEYFGGYRSAGKILVGISPNGKVIFWAALASGKADDFSIPNYIGIKQN